MRKPRLKNSRIYWFLILVIFHASACRNKTENSISIQQFKTLNTVSAGSGICQTKDGLWVVGDDSPYLYLMNITGEIKNKYRLSQIPSFGQENYAKSIKPDFEAIDVFNDTLLIIGSGSQSYTRDTAFVFDSQNRKLLIKKSLHNLYQQFYLKGDFPIGNSINIEGLANDGSYLYFLHRGNVCGNNRIYRVNKKDFLQYLFDFQIELPIFTSYIFDLPTINDNRSGFSGACYSHHENALFVTISVEETNDVYTDGEILGSFIAKIKLQNHIPDKMDLWVVKEDADKYIRTKFESLHEFKNDLSGIHFFTLSDNDNGKTGLYQILVQ